MDICYLLFAISITSVHAEVASPTKSGTWSYMDGTGRTCWLETPNSTIINDLRDSSTALIPVANAQSRIQYKLSYGVFDYVGCVGIKSNPPNTTCMLSDSTREPGLCYSACRTDYFGISWSMCYCFKSKPTPGDGTNCNVDCTRPAGTVCGGYEDKYASLYKTASDDDVGEDDGRYCRLFNYTSSYLQWNDCTSKHFGLCEGEFNYSYPYSIPWQKYIQRHCSTYKYDKFNILNTDLWMATIKSQTFLKCSGMPTATDKLYVTTPTSSPQRSKIAIYAGVPVLVIFIGGLICFLICKRQKRRQRYNNACIKKETLGKDRLDEATRQHNHKQADKNSPDDTYDHAGAIDGVKYHANVSKEGPVYDYCVITSDDTGVSLNLKRQADVSTQNVYDSCVKVSDDTYDHTGVTVGVKRPTDVSVENVYDSCVKVSDDTYDHTGVPVGAKCHADVSVENVYDFCVKVADETYGHTGVSVDVKRNTDVSDENKYDSCV